MEIIDYIDNKNVIVRVNDHFVYRYTYIEFKKGVSKYPFDKSILGVGFIGEGEYSSFTSNNTATGHYTRWLAMMKRCYCPKQLIKQPTYRGCAVCEEWHNFQNFAKWCDENGCEIQGYKMELDKDLLIKGNKLYSPNTCVFIPKQINSLLTNRQNYRGKYPVGVKENGDGFSAKCSVEGTRVNIGTYSSPQLAFFAYKNFKERHIKYMANKYKEVLPNRVYDILMGYEINIVD